MTAHSRLGSSPPATGTPREPARIVRFGAVGVANTVITVATFALLIALGMPSPLASASAFFAGAINSFVINARWTFADLAPAPAAGWRFFSIQCLGAAFSAAGVALVTASGATHMVAELAVVPCVTIALYGLARAFVFRTGPA